MKMPPGPQGSGSNLPGRTTKPGGDTQPNGGTTKTPVPQATSTERYRWQ